MSILNRVRDLTVATLNETLERSEDPVRLIDQFLQSQQSKLNRLEKLYEQTLIHAQSVRREFMTAAKMSGKRENQAMTALKAGEEELARMAMQEKLLQEEKKEQYETLYQQAKHAIIDLERQIGELKNEIREVLDKRHYYEARLESIRLRQSMSRHTGTGASQDYRSAFERLADRIDDMEIEQKAFQEVRSWGSEQHTQVGSAVDEELALLRRKLEKEGWSLQ